MVMEMDQRRKKRREMSQEHRNRAAGVHVSVPHANSGWYKEQYAVSVSHAGGV